MIVQHRVESHPAYPAARRLEPQLAVVSHSRRQPSALITEAQAAFNHGAVRRMGFDFDAGRLDPPHPFCVGALMEPRTASSRIPALSRAYGSLVSNRGEQSASVVSARVAWMDEGRPRRTPMRQRAGFTRGRICPWSGPRASRRVAPPHPTGATGRPRGRMDPPSDIAARPPSHASRIAFAGQAGCVRGALRRAAASRLRNGIPAVPRVGRRASYRPPAHDGRCTKSGIARGGDDGRSRSPASPHTPAGARLIDAGRGVEGPAPLVRGGKTG